MAINGVRFGEGINVIPVLAPVDGSSNPAGTLYVDLDLAHWCTFLVEFGVVTSGDSSTLTVSVECSTAVTSNATEQAISFRYRLSSIAGANAWGAITDGTSDGVEVGMAVDGMAMLIDVDPAAVAAKRANARWVRLWFAHSQSVLLYAAQAFVEHRYPGNVIPSST
jgi:hypothetical protein